MLNTGYNTYSAIHIHAKLFYYGFGLLVFFFFTITSFFDFYLPQHQAVPLDSNNFLFSYSSLFENSR